MKTAAVLLVAIASGALAQAPVLPSCAQDCAQKFFGNGGYAGCGKDFACICGNKDFLSGVACCLAGACSPADQTSAVSYAQQVCTAVGVSVPSAVSCTTSVSATTTAADTTATTTGSSTGSNTGSTTGSAGANSTPAQTTSSTSTSRNFGPKQTPMVGLGALGGLVAAVAML